MWFGGSDVSPTSGWHRCRGPQLLTRVKYKDVTTGKTEFSSLLNYILKTPLVEPGTDVVNSSEKQRNVLKTFLKDWRVVPTCC